MLNQVCPDPLNLPVASIYSSALKLKHLRDRAETGHYAQPHLSTPAFGVQISPSSDP